jgi:hypothetical protein
MGDIKSTLDLVMEKTRHLTLTTEEREAQNLDQARKKIRGLLQKHQGGRINQDQLARGIDEMEKTMGLSVRGLLVEELLNDIDLFRKNEWQLALLEEVCGIDTSAIASLCKGFQGAIQATSQERIQVLKGSLAQERYIDGSAVVPNVETDKLWQTEVLAIKERFARQLIPEKAKLKP